MKRFGPACALSFALLLAACNSPAPAAAPAAGRSLPGPATADSGPKSPNPTLRTVRLGAGNAVVQAELALTPEERERGLMFRDQLPEGRGMLFVFESDQRLAFWMKNTRIPLSIAYLSQDGTIREIFDMEPYSLAPIQSERSVRYALEVPQGWFSRAGLKPGDRIEIPPFDR